MKISLLRGIVAKSTYYTDVVNLSIPMPRDIYVLDTYEVALCGKMRGTRICRYGLGVVTTAAGARIRTLNVADSRGNISLRSSLGLDGHRGNESHCGFLEFVSLPISK